MIRSDGEKNVTWTSEGRTKQNKKITKKIMANRNGDTCGLQLETESTENTQKKKEIK